VTTSLLHASIYAQAIMVMAAQYPDIGVEYPVDGREASNPFNCPYKTKDDRWIQLAMPPFDQYYPRFMPLIGRADLVGNPRYTMENITKNHLNREFCDILYEAFATKTLEEWSEIFVANDIPFSKMQLWEEVIQDEQAWASDVFYSMHYDNGNTRTLVRMPVHLHEAGLSDYQRGPLLGEHSEQVLRELGYSDADLSRMHEAGIYKTWEDVKAKHNG
jgi:cinnamoyl-CoA:phenyllactate CoA-transferase